MDGCFGPVGPHQHGTASRCALGSHMINIKVVNGKVVACGLKYGKLRAEATVVERIAPCCYQKKSQPFQEVPFMRLPSFMLNFPNKHQ